jgi:hypothetical protein
MLHLNIKCRFQQTKDAEYFICLIYGKVPQLLWYCCILYSILIDFEIVQYLIKFEGCNVLSLKFWFVGTWTIFYRW